MKKFNNLTNIDGYIYIATPKISMPGFFICLKIINNGFRISWDSGCNCCGVVRKVITVPDTNQPQQIFAFLKSLDWVKKDITSNYNTNNITNITNDKKIDIKNLNLCKDFLHNVEIFRNNNNVIINSTNIYYTISIKKYYEVYKYNFNLNQYCLSKKTSHNFDIFNHNDIMNV